VRIVAGVVAAETTELLHKLREELGQGDRGVTGPAATIGALARGQVEVLLLADDPDDTRRAWFGPDPAQVATTVDDVRAMGVARPIEGRLGDVLLRATLGTGAGVRIAPAAAVLEEGVGAILRWA